MDGVFGAAGLPLARFRARAAYVVSEVGETIAPLLSMTSSPTPVAGSDLQSSAGGGPLCRKCGVPMVRRTAGKGPNRGKDFYGCPNYPKCREVLPMGSLESSPGGEARGEDASGD